MKTLALAVILLTLVQIASAIDSDWIKSNLRLAPNFGINYTINYEQDKPKYDQATLERKMKAEPQNPNWVFYYAEYLQKNDKDTKDHFDKAAQMFEQAEKMRPLRGVEIANWGKALTHSAFLDEAIDLVEQKLIQKPTDIHKMYYFLIDSYAQKSFYAFMGIEKIPPQQDFELNFNLIVETYDRWRNEGFKIDLAKADKCFQTASNYLLMAPKSPSFSLKDYPDQDAADMQIMLVKAFIEMIEAANDPTLATDKEKDLAAEKIALSIFKKISEPGEYRKKYIEEKSKTDPQVKAAAIFFEILNSFTEQDLASKDFSPKTKTAIENARKKYLEMTKNSKTRGHGYDGLVAVEMMKQNFSPQVKILAQNALKIDPCLNNAFAYLALDYLHSHDFIKMKEIALAKVAKDHSAIGYLALLMAEIITKDTDSTHLTIIEMNKYEKNFPEKYLPSLNIARAIHLTNLGYYYGAVDILIAVIRQLPDKNETRAIALYNASSVALLNEQYKLSYDCIAELERITDKNDPLRLDAFRLRMMIPLDKLK